MFKKIHIEGRIYQRLKLISFKSQESIKFIHHTDK